MPSAKRALVGLMVVSTKWRTQAGLLAFAEGLITR
jgi:hypothetical protein